MYEANKAKKSRLQISESQLINYCNELADDHRMQWETAEYQ